MYNELVCDAEKFGAYLDGMIEQRPELFPLEIVDGYGMKDCINFALPNPNAVRKHDDGFERPAERPNRFSYHNNWMQNPLISANRGGYGVPPQDPVYSGETLGCDKSLFRFFRCMQCFLY